MSSAAIKRQEIRFVTAGEGSQWRFKGFSQSEEKRA